VPARVSGKSSRTFPNIPEDSRRIPEFAPNISILSSAIMDVMNGTKLSGNRHTPDRTIPKRFGSEAEIEQLYGIPRATLQRWRFFGKGPKWVKFGRSVRYAFADFDAWIAAQPSGGGQRPTL
jgi:predicted DNA-binding transcriptional regulator AlpA